MADDTLLLPNSLTGSGKPLALRLFDNGDGTQSLASVMQSDADQTISRILALATTNLVSLKATAANLYAISVFNTAAYTVFLKLYNKASAPVLASDTPVYTIPIAAGREREVTLPPWGEKFPLGLAYAITKLAADTDATVLVAGDLTGKIIWA